MPESKTTRRKLMAQIHIAGKAATGESSGESYKIWMMGITQHLFGIGAESAGGYSESALIKIVQECRKRGLLGERKQNDVPVSLDKEDRPTQAQWAELGRLAQDKGWSGVMDKSLHAFVKRTAKVDHPSFLTRTSMTKCITGLRNWK